MKTLKKIALLLFAVCLTLCMVGCGENDEFDSFEPVGLRVVESLEGTQLETVIDDKETAQKLWDEFKKLEIDTDTRAEMGSSYLYMCFYNEDQSTLAVFTIYENGACCLGEDFETFYTVENGEQAYMNLCDIYLSYEAKDN